MTVVNSKKRTKKGSVGEHIIQAVPELTGEHSQEEVQQEPQPEDTTSEEGGEQATEAEGLPPAEDPQAPPPGQQALPGFQVYQPRLIPDDEGATIGLAVLRFDAEEEEMKRRHKWERDDLKTRRDDYMDHQGSTFELWLRQKRMEGIETRKAEATKKAEQDAISSLEEQSQATEPEQEEDDLERRVAGGEPDEGDEGDGAESDPVEAAA